MLRDVANPLADDIDTANSLYPLPSPPPLASGPSLLDDSDTRFLDSFFDGVSSDQYIDPTETWNYEWTDLPPDFLGTQTSFGQHLDPIGSDVHQQLTFPEFKNPLGFVPIHEHAPPPPPPPPQPSHDTLAGTSYIPNAHHSSDFMAPMAPQQQHMQPQFMGQQMMHNDYNQVRRVAKPNNVMRHAPMSEAMYGGAPYSTFSPSQTLAKKVEIKWGTDSGFQNGQRFVPPPNAITQEDIDECIASTLECFQPGSNVSTRPNSPQTAKQQVFEQRLGSINEALVKADSEDNKAKRKKKTKVKDEDYEDEEENSATKNGRKRRPKSFGAGGDTETPQKRRKSSASSAPKMARENLTEDQKRENHIKSEQKRRTLIKEGFEDLNELVPDLRGGGFSKSAVLIMAADWLEDLINGNKALAAQLAELEGRNGL